ncbi:helix-turn-helix transcriptional regulator [Clostridium sp. ZBS17]|uniref:helix-turn-helix domain-containing protein n=1 Tax=Clostridium sp. ZBS17 TaxID=2949968 RepID=UPI00207A9DF7|nr:helix-turn-helix transcriptional regulator [Clostridium sp. ZBS17]
MNFGERLRQLRKEKELTLRDLGKDLDISFTSLGKYERNERQPDFETLEKIAEYFNVMIDYLLCRTDIKTFDEHIFINDIRHLQEKLKAVNPENRKKIVAIIDYTYLLLNRHLENDSIDFLNIFQKIYKEIYTIDLELDGIATKELIKNNSIPVNQIIDTCSHHKNELNVFFDELLKVYLNKLEKTTNN